MKTYHQLKLEHTALLAVCKEIIAAYANVETCDVPTWLERLEDIVAQIE